MNRIDSLRTYLINVLDELKEDFETFNINFLSNNVDNYSLNKIPTETTIEKTIIGTRTCRDVYNLLSRETYSSNTADNLINQGFWEEFEDKIYFNNENNILPEIKGITKIECLNCGSLEVAETQDCIMSIQIAISYEK